MYWFLVAIHLNSRGYLSSLALLFLAVYPDGRVCISILHTPGDDPMGYELPIERWSPVQSVEKVLLSVVSMLAGERDCPPIHVDVCTLVNVST